MLACQYRRRTEIISVFPFHSCWHGINKVSYSFVLCHNQMFYLRRVWRRYEWSNVWCSISNRRICFLEILTSDPETKLDIYGYRTLDAVWIQQKGYIDHIAVILRCTEAKRILEHFPEPEISYDHHASVPSEIIDSCGAYFVYSA